jgi:hypothetical protein
LAVETANSLAEAAERAVALASEGAGV